MNSPSPVAYLGVNDIGKAIALGKQNASDLREIPTESGTRDGNPIQQSDLRMAGSVWSQGPNGALGIEVADPKGRIAYENFMNLFQTGPFGLAAGGDDPSGGMA